MAKPSSQAKLLLDQSGATALHAHVASRMEAALGGALPQMEVRLHGVSLSASVTVSRDGATGKHELPTLAHDLMQGVRGLLPGSSKTVTKHILRNVSGVFRPGTMTLVMGQPGSGKSALLQLLSGRFPMTKNVTLAGEIAYNGVPLQTMGRRLPQFVGYVPQRDRHYATLTVRETLAFAHECCGAELPMRDEKHFCHGTSEQNEAAKHAAREMARHMPEIVTRQLGLEHCEHTIVGDAMTRGVSGGERKRVTTGEMEFGNKYVTLLDEISTGLDSAAAYDIVKTQLSVAKTFRKTFLTALLQPAPEVFELFDDVLILNDGYVMYHGPRGQAVAYFESLGFCCPRGRDVADFLMDLGTRQQTRYEVAGFPTGLLPRRPAEFARLFDASAIHAAMLQRVHSEQDPALAAYVETHFNEVPEFHQSFFASVATIAKRELCVVLRNDALIKGRAAMIAVVGLLYASLFYHSNALKVQVVMGTLYAAVLFLALGHSSQMPTLLAARDVFYKQRSANFFRTPAYVVGLSLSQVPVLLTETLIFGSLVYWMCGFVADASAFFTFELLLFAVNLAFLAWFTFLSSVSPNLNVAESLALLSVIFYILFAGFLITHDNIPVYFSWAYWFNPISWCLRSLAINQYRSPEFDVCRKGVINYCFKFRKQAGAYLLSVFQIQSEKEWLWYGLAYLLASYVAFMALSALVLEYVRYESPEHVSFVPDDDSEPLESYDRISDSDALLELASTRSDATDDEYAPVHTPHNVTVAVAHPASRCLTPVTLAFQDLRYSVPDPADPKQEIELLKGISGFALPGSITALMGSSGAGKTTLMDVIAGRKTGGTIRGEILLNGHAATNRVVRRITGYCEQMDIHSQSSTFREAIAFSAFLRQDASVSDADKHESVEEVLDLLGLQPLADQLIRGSSVEQMKRLTIGVELAAQPSVLFLDEPTSGLDARSAKVIMDGVRKVADTGRTVVCTIHQPSWEVFQVFDSLLLLKRGGETVYFGEIGDHASELVAYFEAIDGVSSLPDGYNPATWMLEVIGAGVGTSGAAVNREAVTDFVSVFHKSKAYAALQAGLDRDGIVRPAPGAAPLTFRNRRAATAWTQAKLLLRRFHNMYWRTSDYNLIRVATFLLLAVIFGLTFFGISSVYSTYQGINAGVAMVFITTVFAGVVSFESILPIAAEERPAFYRERASETYSTLWYFVGSSLIEIPYVFGSCLVFCGIFFPMVGFTGAWRFLLYWVHTSLHVLLQTYIGEFFAFAFSSVELAMVVGIIMNSIFFLFMGYNPPVGAIPSGYRWIYHLVPPKYSFAIVTALVFGECEDRADIGCKRLTGELPPAVRRGTPIREFVEHVYNIRRDELWANFGVVMGYIVLFRVLTLLAMRYVNHQKR